MVEPPSKPLLETLLELKLCTPRDLRRCRGRVRRLARDVPVFDSVWIDALVQARKLTPFQARSLERGRRSQLAVGPCVLIDPLSRSAEARTFLARRRDGNERFVLKLIEHPAEQIDGTLAALDELLDRLREFSHPSLVTPHSFSRQGPRLVAISRYVPGPHVGELLVRRGRFPAEVIVALGGQLIDGLARLEEFGGTHGDIRLPNIRLTDGGAAALVDGGLVPILSPELVITPGIAPERYDAIAPELIGTGAVPNARSDIYALGCVLWQLLAGRPPFPTGDPLAKLAAHQTSAIPDIREWAPDTPAPLAETLRVLTARDPARRPSSFAELRQRWPNRRTARRRLSRFRAMFNTSAPRVPRVARDPAVGKWPVMVLLMFVLTGATLTMLDAQTAAPLLELRSQVEAFLGNHGTGVAQTIEPAATASSGLKPLPVPDSDGVLRLDSHGPYEAADVSWVGPLVIRGTGEAVPEIIIDDRPFRVWAEQVALQNVHFRTRRDGSSPKMSAAPTLLEVQAQSLTLDRCSFQRAAADSASANDSPAFIAWKALDRNDRSGTLVSLRDVVLLGDGSALAAGTGTARVSFSNCLKGGAGPLCVVDALPAPGQSLRFRVKQTTLRAATGVLQLPAAGEATTPGRVQIDLESCVIDVAGPGAALVQFAGDRLSPDAVGAVEISGDETFVSPETPVARWLRAGQAPAALDETAIAVEGLFASPFAFAGSNIGELEHSKLAAFRAPIRTTRTPGVSVETLRLPVR